MTILYLVDKAEKKELAEEHYNDEHIRILQDRLHYAIKRREALLEKNPDLVNTDLYFIDSDIAEKKRDLENALDFQRRERRGDHYYYLHKITRKKQDD